MKQENFAQYNGQVLYINYDQPDGSHWGTRVVVHEQTVYQIGNRQHWGDHDELSQIPIPLCKIPAGNITRIVSVMDKTKNIERAVLEALQNGQETAKMDTPFKEVSFNLLSQ